MSNIEKLQELLEDVLLLEDGEFNLDLTKDQVETWDSLATVSIGVGIQETFGYHPTEEEAIALISVKHIIDLLNSKDIAV